MFLVGSVADPVVAVFQDQLQFRFSGEMVNSVSIFKSNGFIIAAVDDQDVID